MVDTPEPPPLRHDVNFEITPGGYEIWFSDRIALDRSDLVDECGDWLEDQVGIVNLGQIDHKALVADRALTDELKGSLFSRWGDRIPDLGQ